MRKNKLEWYAYLHNYNEDHLSKFNVLHILEDDRNMKRLKKCNTYDEVKNLLRTMLMSMYWSRTEYEFIVSEWTGKEFKQKIDVWFQIEPNLDRLTEYVIRNIKVLNGKING